MIRMRASEYGMSARMLSLVVALSWIGSAFAASTVTDPSLARPGESATLLSDGNWLLLGGETAGKPSDEAVLYNPQTGTKRSLVAHLNVARAWHTATVLPDGRVFIFGGIGVNGHAIARPELYDPETQTFTSSGRTGLLPRAHHIADVLTDGRLLLAGGSSPPSAQLWDPTSAAISSPENSMLATRMDATSELLSTGAILITGGTNAAGTPLPTSDVFVPSLNRFSSSDRAAQLLPQSPNTGAAVQVAQTLPQQGATNVRVNAYLAVRFSSQVNVQTLNASTVTLIGPAGIVGAKVVAAEQGMLLFVTPRTQLLPGAFYVLFLRGAQDGTGRPVVPLTLGFSTAPLDTPVAASISHANSAVVGAAETGSSVWQPPSTGLWDIAPSNARPHGDARKLPPLIAPAGSSALSGQVLLQNGAPLANVRVSVGSQRTMTDDTGRFLLQGLSPGHVELFVDGRTASTRSTAYGQFLIGAEVISGVTSSLNFTIWMPVIDTAHAVPLPSPTTREVDVTSPLLPGVVLKIPAGAIIRNVDGSIATSVSLTPVPLNRSPFPIPHFSMYFVIQPGGATIESVTGQRLGATLVYPNHGKRPPGAKSEFVYYDPSGAGWTPYGTGTVSSTGTEVDPDRDTKLYSFSGFGDQQAYNPPPATNPPPNGCQTNGSPASGSDGDPIDCATGLFLYSHVDLVVPDTIPIVIRRTYQSSDTQPRNFGIGFSFDYNLWLYDAAGPTDEDFATLDLVLPDGSLVPFTRTAQSAPTGVNGLQMVASPTPTQYNGATITYDGAAYLIMTTKDGTQYKFNEGDGRYLRAIAKPNGQTLQVIAAASQTGENYPIVTLTSPNGRSVEIQYAAGSADDNYYPAGTNEISSITDDTGRTVSYSYDSQGRLTTVTYADGGTEQFTYDGTSDRIVSDILPNGQTRVTNVYDTKGRVSQQTLANGGVYKFSYTTNSGGQIVETDITDPRGYVRTILFNDAGYVISSTRAAGTSPAETTTFQRDPTSNLITSATDQLGRTTAYTYDGSGNVTSATSMAGTSEAATYSYSYTSQYSELASVTDPLNHTVSFGYDNVGNLTRITDALNESTSLSYNVEGLPATITDPMGKITTLTYTAGVLTTISDPLGRATRVLPDASGLTSAVIDPAGNETVYARDAMGRVTSVVDASGGTTRFSYDLDGNLTSVIDPKGHTSLLTYNSMDKLASRRDALNQTESWTYDQDDNVVNYTDRMNQQRIMTYDSLDRLSQVEYETATGSVQSTIGYTYDLANRLTEANDSAGGPLSVSYDDFDRVAAVTTSNGGVSYSYDAAGRRLQMTVSDGSDPITYAYDATGRLTGVTQASASVSVQYDTDGRRSTLTLPNGIQLEYAYDDASQLTGMTYSLAGTEVGTLTYAYDQDGHIISRGGTLDEPQPPQLIASATYDANNRLTSLGTTSLTYDANGNLLSDGTTTYAWNVRNQLAGMSGGTSAAFSYDAFGRRLSQSVVGASTQYLYDGQNVLQELRSGRVAASYLGGVGLDDLYGRTDSAGARYYLSDVVGSVLALTDENGSVQTTYSYDSYGGATAAGSSSANPMLYAGGQNDGTGLYYFRARYYDPAIARFVSEDPASLLGGINGYSYALGNPVSYLDPLGLHCLTAAQMAGISGAVGGLVAGIGGGLPGMLVGAAMGGAMGWASAESVPPIPGADAVNAGIGGGVSGVTSDTGQYTVPGGIVGGVVGYAVTASLGGGLAAQAIGGGIGGAVGNFFSTPGTWGAGFSSAASGGLFGLAGGLAGGLAQDLLDWTRDPNCDCKQ